MRDRIASHRAERGPEFETIEEPRELARVIAEAGDRYGAIVVDCLTLWLSNLMFGGSTDIRRETANLLRVACESPSTVVLVTNEVGCGIVPENALARQFRDLAGAMNQQAAAAAQEVYWMAFGISMRLR
jgi:adenosylcobinamide kinase/adenosylcobinamide-phosphate guanylyltransferase